ncbi:MAG: restriction endonuclease subunit S [Cyanobacteriota bacterium]|jgi:type I restriction enzyme S subunit
MSELRQIEEIAQVKQGRYTSPNELSEIPTEYSKVPVWGANGILGYTQNATYEEAQPLVTCRGNGCGLIQWSGGRAHISNNAMAIVLPNQSQQSSKYLYYSLLNTDFTDVTTGSAQPQITMGHLNKKEIFWHSNPEERTAIAHILGTLDDKIELNRKTNETLEAMAKALFKSWFVDFDPVRAKAEGRPTGLPAEISDLFPDSLEDSELGEIPSGWEIAPLGDHIDLIKGRSYKSDELNPSTTALVTLKSFHRNGGYRPDGLKEFTGEYKEQQVVKPGELVIALTDVTQAADVIGRPAIVKSDSQCSTLVASLDVGIVRPKATGCLSTPYLYFLMLTPRYVQHILGYTSGTTVLHLAKDGASNFLLSIGSLPLLNHFAQLADSILRQVDASARQSELLVKTRDALLPKLISGEIRIPDAERMLEEVGV